MDLSDLLARHDYKHPRLVHDALGYAAIGLRVVPLYERDKRPRIERWQRRGTTDPDRIVEWFERWPESNVAILTGGGIIALDVDPRNGGKQSLKELLVRRTLPATAHARTGGDGDHYLFRVDPTLQIGNINGLRPGLDIKGERGCLVVEPSVHPTTGKEYTWHRLPKHGIAVAPAWLLKLVVDRGDGRAPCRSTRPVESTRSGEEDTLLADAIDRFPVSGPGRRNETMVRLVCSLMGRGYLADVIEEVVDRWWRHFYD